jgi:glycerol-3-phosphate cytidylyltransferase
VRLLKRLKSLGDYLIVGISTDAFNEAKGKSTIMPYSQRKEVIESLKYVDATIPEHSWEQKEDDIMRLSVDIFAMGDDWSGKFDQLNNFCKVLYLPRTKHISSTEFKTLLNDASYSKAELKKAFTLLEWLSHDLE